MSRTLYMIIYVLVVTAFNPAIFIITALSAATTPRGMQRRGATV
jgi:hypothetical protein